MLTMDTVTNSATVVINMELSVVVIDNVVMDVDVVATGVKNVNRIDGTGSINNGGGTTTTGVNTVNTNGSGGKLRWYNKYCWKHVRCRHLGVTCNTPGQGHQHKKPSKT